LPTSKVLLVGGVTSVVVRLYCLAVWGAKLRWIAWGQSRWCLVWLRGGRRSRRQLGAAVDYIIW